MRYSFLAGCAGVGTGDGARVRFAHVSDTHVGYESLAATNAAGSNQRGADVVEAFSAASKQIVAADLPLVIHSGDVADRPTVAVNYQLSLCHIFERMASLRADGTRRQVVVIAGNHDTSPHASHGCQLNLFRPIAGVHVVTSGYRQIDFSSVPDADSSLADLVVHALPHDSLKNLDEFDVRPVPGRVNVLVTHGVAGGIEAFVRHQGREYVVPAELLGLEWDYVALGHFHRCGPVSLAGGSGAVKNSRAWYAGASEHLGFSDAPGSSHSERMWLDVTLTPGELPAVTRTRFPTRLMVTLPDIDAAGMDPSALSAALATAASAAPDGCVARQKVSNVAQDVWALVDTAPAKRAAGNCLSYRIVARPTLVAGAASHPSSSGTGALASALAARLSLVEEPLRPVVTERAQALLRSSLDAYAPADSSDPDGAPELDTVAPPDSSDRPVPSEAAQVEGSARLRRRAVPLSDSARERGRASVLEEFGLSVLSKESGS